MELSSVISQVFSGDDKEISLKAILDGIKERGFGLMLVVLALPSALPVPAPGYSIPFGIVLMFLAGQIIIGRNSLWFPDFITKIKVPANQDSKLLKSMLKFLKFFEKFIKPRVSTLAKNPIWQKALAIVVLLCAISMLIPIPLTNTIPALGIFIIGLSLTQEDGLAGIFGAATGLAGIGFTSFLLYLITFIGYESINTVKDFIKNLI